MKYYEAIGGSRCYGLNVEESDIDLFRIGDSWNVAGHEGSYHVIQVPRSEFADKAILLQEATLYIQWWFPAEILTSGDLSEYMAVNRERVAFAARNRVWELHWKAAQGMALYPEHFYPRFPKRLAYSTHFYDMLARYASGEPFAAAIRAQGTMRQKLIAMRTNQLPFAEAAAINAEARKRAESLAEWYRPAPDFGFLSQIREDLKRILKVETFHQNCVQKERI